MRKKMRTEIIVDISIVNYSIARDIYIQARKDNMKDNLKGCFLYMLTLTLPLVMFLRLVLAKL